MAFQSEFTPLGLDELHREAAVLKTEGWRFVQTHAVKCDEGVDLYYSFMKDGRLVNYRIEGVKNEPVPSITDLFLAAFVFENEARELFGIDMRDIAIDFEGAMYAPAIGEPMTIISPEQKAAREKAKKAAAAKKAKEPQAEGEPAPKKDEPAPAKEPIATTAGGTTPSDASETPEAPRASDRQIETLLSLMDAEKADIVRNVLGEKGGE